MCVKRTLQRLIENTLAVQVLGGQFGEGDEILVEVDPKGETLVFRKQLAEARPA